MLVSEYTAVPKKDCGYHHHLLLLLHFYQLQLEVKGLFESDCCFLREGFKGFLNPKNQNEVAKKF